MVPSLGDDLGALAVASPEPSNASAFGGGVTLVFPNACRAYLAPWINQIATYFLPKNALQVYGGRPTESPSP